MFKVFHNKLPLDSAFTWSFAIALGTFLPPCVALAIFLPSFMAKLIVIAISMTVANAINIALGDAFVNLIV